MPHNGIRYKKGNGMAQDSTTTVNLIEGTQGWYAYLTMIDQLYLSTTENTVQVGPWGSTLSPN